MGCAAGKSAAVGSEAGGKPMRKGNPPMAIATEVPPLVTVPEEAVTGDIEFSSRTTQGLAFEVQLGEEDNVIKKHPPKRLQRLEDQQMPSLTHRLLDEKQAEAEQRRQKILSERVQSAKAHQKTMKKLMNTENGLLIESMNREPTTVEL